MKPAVIYFSRTGNTKRLAEAIAGELKAPIFAMSETQSSALLDFDLLAVGTPVEGSSPAKEASAFIASMPKTEGKKAVVFCTNRIFGSGRTMNKVEKMLEAKGYETILKVSKRGMQPSKETDFSDILAQVKTTLEKP